MSNREFTIADLTRVLREAAGEADGVSLGADILDVCFADLGYESLAMLETRSRIEREYGIKLGEEALVEVQTPAELIELVNAALAAAPVT